MANKLTMAEIWEELDEGERHTIATMIGTSVGGLALTKLSNVLKALAYRYCDKPEVDRQELAHQVELQRRQYEAQIEHERQKQIYDDMRMRRTATTDNTKIPEWWK